MSSHLLTREILSVHLSRFWQLALGGVVLVLASTQLSHAQSNSSIPLIHIEADSVVGKVSPKLYGFMTEEINYSYDGGIYAELVRNRTFKDNATNAVHWSLIQDGDATGSMTLDRSVTVNEALNVSLRLDITNASKAHQVGIANEGYWGIPVKPDTHYTYSFWAKADTNFNGPVTVSLMGGTNGTVLASLTIHEMKEKWQKYEGTLSTGNVAPSRDNLFVISAGSSGTIWFSQPSLFPPTYHNRPNGNRPDIMQLLADMNGTFLRFPGGNYVEGNAISNHFDWKKTIGDISERPGHFNDAWGYWSSDGLGLLEFLEWCEDLKIQPVLAVYAGYSMRQGSASAGQMDGFVQDALDEIEYCTGDSSTKWGTRRAQDGHKAPFKLDYVEIGNEDNLGSAGRTYDARFTQFYDAIKKNYPDLKIISTAPSSTSLIKTRRPDAMDDHYYRNSMEMQSDTHHYDERDRNDPSKIFVGEWATREGAPTPNLNAALGDAAWMTGIERNSDVIIMSCYAPLFVNVSDISSRRSSMQWATDLIGYDALNSYGSPSYYAQKLFATYHGDLILSTAEQNIPTRDWQPPANRRNSQASATSPPARQVSTIFYDATRDLHQGYIYVKIINTAATPQPVQVEVNSNHKVKNSASVIELTSANPTDVNSIQEPTKVAPIIKREKGFGASFSRTYPPNSITVLQLETQ